MYVYEILCLKTILKIVLIFHISTPLRFLENVYEKKMILLASKKNKIKIPT